MIKFIRFLFVLFFVVVVVVFFFFFFLSVIGRDNVVDLWPHVSNKPG